MAVVLFIIVGIFQVYDWLDGLTKSRLVNTRPANMIIEELPRLFPKMKIDLRKLSPN